MRVEAEEAVDRIIAEMVARPKEECFLRDALKSGNLPEYPHISWINWPTAIPEYRAKLFGWETQGEVEGWIQGKLINGKVTLVLDDIGADRKTGQDWSGELLVRVIDERLMWERRTFWTSNLDRKELIDRYGGRTVSRLLELAPAVELPSLPAFRRGPTQ
jgi:hypothetical protein